LGKILENLGKTSENLGKIPENLVQILENPSKNGAQRLQKSTIRTILEVTPKTVFHVLCGEN